MHAENRRTRHPDCELAPLLAAGRRARAEAVREAGRMIARAVRRLLAREAQASGVPAE